MKNALSIFAFTILVTLFYWYVGQQVPQKETHPPKSIEISQDLSTGEMVEIGKQLVEGKGTCLTCHTIGSEQPGRFPDLANIGARAATRKQGMSAVEYIAESMYDPNAYIVEGFAPGMPTINKPPISLSDTEILTIIAYLQSLGSTPTVTMDTKLPWQGQAPSESAAPAEPAAGKTAAGELSGEAIFKEYICNTCHKTDAPGKLVGPSLYDVGKRLTRAQIYESILDPDAAIAEGFPAGVMPATLKAGKFYEKVSTQQLKVLVDYLESLKGNQ